MKMEPVAIEKLRLYEPKKAALDNIPLEIRRLESEMRSIRSASADGTPVSGGGSGREEMLLSNILRRDELGRSLEQARCWVEQVEGALGVLSQEERDILNRFYIHPAAGVADALAGELHIDVKTVYKRRAAAMWRFCHALCGATEI
jgi:hypothetical protein